MEGKEEEEFFNTSIVVREKWRETVILGSRSSQLALIQTELVQRLLVKNNIDQNLKFTIEAVKTKGDKILEVALSKIGDKGLFTKELEVALICHRTDLAVHSLKDCPTTQPSGLSIVATTERENPYDAVVMHNKHQGKNIEDLPEGAIVGTSSLRRIAQLKRFYPHLQFKDIRGNLNTRFSKLDSSNEYDCIILACAGLIRMGLTSRISQQLSISICCPAVGQGALGIECRENDSWIRALIQNINHLKTQLACTAEREFLRQLEGGCQVPIAAHGHFEDDSDGKSTLILQGRVLSLDGKQCVEGSRTLQLECSIFDAKNQLAEDALQTASNLGATLAQALLSQGAGLILEKLRSQSDGIQDRDD